MTPQPRYDDWDEYAELCQEEIDDDVKETEGCLEDYLPAPQSWKNP